MTDIILFIRYIVKVGYRVIISGQTDLTEQTKGYIVRMATSLPRRCSLLRVHTTQTRTFVSVFRPEKKLNFVFRRFSRGFSERFALKGRIVPRLGVVEI